MVTATTGAVTWKTEHRWSREPDLSAWIAQSRLNLLRALPDHAAEPTVQTALQRYVTHVRPATKRLEQLDGGPPQRQAAATGS